MTEQPGGEVTRLLRRIADGDGAAEHRLAEVVYGELRTLAARHLRGVRGGTLQPTALVHEAWLRLGGDGVQAIGSRRHLLGVASKAMRSVLVDHVRRRRARKRTAPVDGTRLDEAVSFLEAGEVDLLDLHEALAELETDDPDLARWVELRFFGGLTHAEIADLEGCSVSSIERGWRLARARIARRLGGGGGA